MYKLNFPADHQQVMPYLVIDDAPAFITFMQTVFDAKEKMRFMADEKNIAHAEITIGHSVIMIANPIAGLKPQSGGGFIYVGDADAIFAKALANGATTALPMKDNPYGRSGGFTDPFGNTWWVKTYRSNM
jgi:PhnB protein